jgi:tetratricopeptide (TPR) repeat protein
MTGDLGQELREARRSSGLAFRRFARLAGYSEGHLRSVENGRRVVTSDVAAAYDRVLATGGAFAAQLDIPGRSDVLDSAPWNRVGTDAALCGFDDESGMNRRTAVALPGAAIAGVALRWVDALKESAPPVGGGSRRVDGVLVDHIDQRLDHLRHLDDQIGSGQLAALARSELTLIVQLLRRGCYTEPIGRRLYSLAAEASRQAAWSYFDQDQHAVAGRWFELSLRASATAGDHVAGAYTMSFLAVQCYSIGQPRQAVSLLETATAVTSRVATPRLSAMLAARTARALSKMGDRRGCARMLHVARAALDRGASADDPPILYWVNEAEIEMIAGSCALDLGSPAEAIRRFDAARDADRDRDNEFARSGAIYLARAAQAHLQLGDLDGALVRAHDARRCLGGVDSTRSASTLGDLRSRLVAHASDPNVRDFLDATTS